jgi:hypothetical protein
VAFDPLTKDDFAADRAAVFAFDFQQRFQFGEHGWPPVACDTATSLIVRRSETDGKRRLAHSGTGKMARDP